MHATAERIREAAAAGQLDALDLQHDALDDEAAVREGRILLRLHQRRERDARLRQRKINTVLAAGRPLECEVCAFHFGRTYGPLGKGYIEVHHVTPLYASGETVTSLADLALLCSNCHRMCHRSGGTSEPWRTPAELRELMLGFDAVDSGTTS
ncbi:HNH endonuclease [Streptomyces sp. SCUT-3]|uniref:HNH endonuclease n=1 Tax=Streptomyces sp. SCUT-3 TaxID=2684469 RepID=UPI0021750891|nr:HNH endonuclease [Streptomyces sp. SCUT-3]